MEEPIDSESKEEQIETHDAAPISHSESQVSEPLKYKSIAQIYTGTSPMQIDDEDCLLSLEEPITYSEAA